MYENHFGLKFRPFSATPDSRLLYQTTNLQQTIDSLEKTLRLGDGIGMLTAAAGTGKTLVCKVLHERLTENPLSVLLLNSAYATRSSLLQAILFEMGQSYQRMSEQELRLELVTAGRAIAESQTGIALLVDEAHLLGEHILEELRGLTNFVLKGRPIFRVMLAGQYALEDLLAKKSMESFNQRLKCQLTLELLSRQQSLEYIMTRVQVAGGELLEIFSEPALELIVHAADGLPRCLNQLCDHACVLATLNERTHVESVDVREALQDLQKLPLHWNVSLPTADPLTALRGESKAEIAHPVPFSSTTHEQSTSVESEWDFSEHRNTPASANMVSVAHTSKTPSATDVPQTAFLEIGSGLDPQSTSTVATAADDLIEELQSELTTTADDITAYTSKVDSESLDLTEGWSESDDSLSLINSISEEQETVTATAMDELMLQDNLDDQLADFARELAEDCLSEGKQQPSAKSVNEIQHAVEAAFAVSTPAISATNSAAHDQCQHDQCHHEDSKMSSTPAAAREELAVTEIAIVNIKDHYAELDAQRRGQYWTYDSKTTSINWSTAVDVSPDISLPGQELEEQIGQAVFELYEQVQTAISSADQDDVPVPEQFLKNWADSRTASHDLVEPAEETAYDQLYSQLRKKA